MPWPGPRRELIAFRLGADEIAWLDERALVEGFTGPRGEPNRSEVIRLAVQHAMLYMQPGWRP